MLRMLVNHTALIAIACRCDISVQPWLKELKYSREGQRVRLRELFSQIEKEFDILWQENAERTTLPCVIHLVLLRLLSYSLAVVPFLFVLLSFNSRLSFT